MSLSLISFAFLTFAFTIAILILDSRCIVSGFTAAVSSCSKRSRNRRCCNSSARPRQSSSFSFSTSPHRNEDTPLQQTAPIVVETKRVQLSQVSAEIMTCRPPSSRNDSVSSSSRQSPTLPPPPLLFLHGSFHSSWCWAEHYMPYFASHGYSCYALSLRGTGGTFAGEGVKKVKIDQHVQDVTDMIAYIQQQEEKEKKKEGWNKYNDEDGLERCKPVLIAHSFGGLAIMKYLEKNLLVIPSSSSSKEDHAMGQSHSLSKRNHRLLDIGGVISMCSVPPSGNGKMTMRFLKRSLRDSWKITAGLAMKKCIHDRELCRELFFGSELEDGISDEDLSRFQQYFERDTVATIDLMDLAKRLPSVQTDDSGKAIFWEDDRDLVIPSLVIGATDDFIVDKEGVEELARYYGVEPIMVDSAHDVMLGSRWENGAKVILDFLEENFMVEK